MLPTIAPAKTPVFEDLDSFEESENIPVADPGVDVEAAVPVDVDLDRGGGVVLAITAAPRAKPSYGNANAWSLGFGATKIEEAFTLDSSYEVIVMSEANILLKHVPPNAGRSEGGLAAGANPSQPL